jgi:hypothetical protein
LVFGLLFPRLFAPRVPSAWWVQTGRVDTFGRGVLHVLRVFLSVFVSIRLARGFWWKVVWRTFDSVGQGLLVESCLADNPPGRRGQSEWHELIADRPRAWYEPSARRGVGWVVLFVFNGPSTVGCGPSARCPRIVRQVTADRPPGDRGQSAWLF